MGYVLSEPTCDIPLDDDCGFDGDDRPQSPLLNGNLHSTRRITNVLMTIVHCGVKEEWQIGDTLRPDDDDDDVRRTIINEHCRLIMTDIFIIFVHDSTTFSFRF